MTNDKTAPVVSAGQYSGAGFGRSLSESEYLPTSTKRPRREMLPEDVQTNCYETKKYHRLIEKRRRDRINDCIYQLKDLLPNDIIKSTMKPMEKAVILELVVKYVQNIAQKRKNQNGRSLEFMNGYKSCTDKVLTFLNSVIDETQKEALRNHIMEGVPVSSSPALQAERTQYTVEKGVIGPPSTTQSQEVEEPPKDNSFSSESSLSSSPNSELSLCTDNSDSSSCRNTNNNVQKVAKKKVFHHYRSGGSNQPKRQARAIPGNSPSQAPVFINMPFMMGPGMMPAAQFVSGDSSKSNSEVSSPRLLQSIPMSSPGGVIMPQVNGDGNGTVPFPAFFMTCGSQPWGDRQAMQQTQNAAMEPMVLQPTMMMPVRSQSNFVLMPSYPVMPQFQPPTLVPVVTSTDTSPSE